MLPIFIVSLKKDVEKREAISKVLNNFNLDFKFIDAVYGKELSTEYLQSLRDKSVGKIIDRGFSATPGEIGCTLSHLKVYQEVIKKDIQWACVLEDDAILDDRFKVFVENFKEEGLRPDNLYLLGGQRPISKKLIVKSVRNIRIVGMQRFHKTIRSEQHIYRTCCYLISSDLAKSLIDLSEDEFILADDWAYLVKRSLIKDIYLSDFVGHPIDLSGSNIENERKAEIDKNKISKKSVKLRGRISKAIKWRLRLLALKTYRYVEKKDRI